MEEGSLFGTFVAAKSRSYNHETFVSGPKEKPAVLSRFNAL
jgi:hypothetical protein